MEGEREREKHLTHTSTRIELETQGIRPDQELNCRPFALWNNAQLKMASAITFFLYFHLLIDTYYFHILATANNVAMSM